jgi:RecA-family ATPase
VGVARPDPGAHRHLAARRRWHREVHLLQQLATSAALGLALLGGESLAQCKVLAWFGEDDRDEIWRRQTAINRTLGIANPAEALSKALRPNGPTGPADPTGLLPLVGKAEFHALPGEDITLFLAKNEGDYAEGPALSILREQIGDFRPGLVLLDSVAKIYGGPENNRQLVTRCVQRLIQLCLEFGATILLNGHDNKAGEYSGTTAWENTVRSRLHFKREVEIDDNGKPIKGGDSHNVLIRPKTNYAAPDDLGIAMRWFGGALVSLNPDHVTPEMQAAMCQAETEADQAFLEALHQLTTRQVTTSDASTSTYYAPKQILKHGLANNLSQRDLAKAMRRLIMSGVIARGELPWRTKHRTPAVGITIVTHKL